LLSHGERQLDATALAVSKRIEGKDVKITERLEMYKESPKSDQCGITAGD